MNLLVDLAVVVRLVPATELPEEVHANASLDGAGSRAVNAQTVTGDQSVKVCHSSLG